MAGRALVGGFQNVPTAPAIVINKLTDSLHEYYNELSDPRIVWELSLFDGVEA